MLTYKSDKTYLFISVLVILKFKKQDYIIGGVKKLANKKEKQMIYVRNF